jgi:multidrug resistance efflux pump
MVMPTATGSQEPVAPESRPAQPPAGRPRRGTFRKWRARFIVLLLIAAAVYVGLRINQVKAGDAARIDLGTVTLTARVIPVETPRTGQVTSVDVSATQKISEGQQVGTVEVTTTNSQGNPVTSTVKLTAPQNGIVVDDPLPVGDTLQPGEPFVELYDPAKFTFTGQIPLTYLPELARGMVASLQAEGLDGDVKAVVERLVPRVGTSQTDVKADHMRIILVPRDEADMAGLVPGLRFTGYVDTRTGDSQHGRLVHLGG